MSGIVEVKGRIRKALSTPLETVAAAQVPPLAVQYDGMAIDRSGLPEYITVGTGFAYIKPIEIGPNPRWIGKGSLTLVIRTPTARSADRNDALAGIISAAYPYGQLLTHDGISVVIDNITTEGYGLDGAWLYSAVVIGWEIQRRT